MSAAAAYSAALKAPYSLPAKYGYFLAAWAFLCTRWNEPEPGTREIDLAEWGATPTEYLLHPSMHPKLLSRWPEESKVEDKRAALFKQLGKADPNPAAPVGAHH